MHFVIEVQLKFGLGHMETAVCLVIEKVLKCFFIFWKQCPPK